MGGFICTLIGVICKACVDALAGGETGGNAGFTNSLFTGLAVVLTVIGVLLTVIPAKPAKNKLIVLGIHAAIWVVGYFLLQFIIPIILVAVLLCVVLTFLGFHPLSAIFRLISGSAPAQEENFVPVQQPTEPPAEQKVEAWRRTENGGRQDLRVNSSGDMYYDPDDGDWHKIKK